MALASKYTFRSERRRTLNPFVLSVETSAMRGDLDGVHGEVKFSPANGTCEIQGAVPGPGHVLRSLGLLPPKRGTCTSGMYPCGGGLGILMRYSQKHGIPVRPFPTEAVTATPARTAAS